MFRELFGRLPDPEVIGEPTYLASTRNGISVSPASTRPRRAVTDSHPRIETLLFAYAERIDRERQTREFVKTLLDELR